MIQRYSNKLKLDYSLSYILIISLFLLWGIASNLNGVLVNELTNILSLGHWQKEFIQFVFYFGYFIMALPAAFLIRKYDYKAGIIIGLLFYGIGSFLFYPATDLQTYSLFLIALLVIATGLSFLETAANPFVLSMGSKKNAIARLNLAQSFNPIGFLVSIGLSQKFIYSNSGVIHEQIDLLNSYQKQLSKIAEANNALMPYLIVGIIVIVWALFIFLIKLPIAPEHQTDRLNPRNKMKWSNLLREKKLRYAIVAQFFYMGAQVGIWSYIPSYTNYLDIEVSLFSSYLFYSLMAFMAGRFIGSLIIYYISSRLVIGIYSCISLLLTILAFVVGGEVALWCLIGTSFFMSIMFPTIFGIGLDGMINGRKFGSALIVMGMIGGTLLTLLMGQIESSQNMTISLMVPCVSFLVIIWFAFNKHTKLQPTL